MSACSFEYLLQFVTRKLGLDEQLEVYNHLDRCDICREAVHHISRDLHVYASKHIHSLRPVFPDLP